MSEKEVDNKPKGRGRGRARPASTQPATPVGTPAPTPVPPSSVSAQAPGSKTTPKLTEDEEYKLYQDRKFGGRGMDKPSGDDIQKEIDDMAKEMKTMQLTSVMKRPNHGTNGRVIRLESNFFALKINDGLVVQRYQVEWESRRKLLKEECRTLFWYLVTQNPTIFKNPYEVVYDDSKCLYSISKLPIKLGEEKFELRLQLPSDNRPSDYVGKLQYTGQHHVDIRQSYGPDMTDRTMAPVQIIDVILSQFSRCSLFPEMLSKWYSWGKCLYTMPSDGPTDKTNLSSGRVMWNGYHSAAKISDKWEPLINVDIQHTPFYKGVGRECSVIEFMCDILNGKDDFRPKFTPSQIGPTTVFPQEFIYKLEKELKNLKLRSNHLPTVDGKSKNQSFKFMKVSQKPADMKFMGPNGETTVLQYYADKYPGMLKYPNLPCLQLGTKHKNCHIPMEFMNLLNEPQKVQNNRVSGEQTSRLIRFAAKPAPTRKEHILALLRASQACQIEMSKGKDPFCDSFGLELDLNMKKLKGRVLPTPTLLLNKGQSKVVPRDGAWKQASSFYDPAPVVNWIVVAYDLAPDFLQRVLQPFCGALCNWMQQYGVNMRPVYNCYNMARTNQADSKIAQLFKQALEQYTKAPDPNNESVNMILVAMNNTDAPMYNAVKRYGDIEYGVITQCLLRKNIDKSMSSGGRPNATSENFCLKINMKMGGVNNAIEPNAIWDKFTTPKNATLFLGVDVTHPGPFDNGPSIAGIVGNVRLDASQWCSSSKIQRSRREHVIYMVDQIRDRLMSFYQNTGVKPVRIIVYRDGVSEGEFLKVLKEEMGSVRGACKALHEDYRPHITFIVVQKRHHTRFFCFDREDESGKARNIPPGTCVDQGVVSPVHFDFYLCSHAGIQGTSRPAHYCVLHDDSGFTADELQMLSYQLCHLYGRCNRVVGIPAPVYLADKACTRSRVHYDGKFKTTSSGSGATDAGGAAHHASGSSRSDEDLEMAVKVHDKLKLKAYFA